MDLQAIPFSNDLPKRAHLPAKQAGLDQIYADEMSPVKTRTDTRLPNEVVLGHGARRFSSICSAGDTTGAGEFKPIDQVYHIPQQQQPQNR